MIKETIINFPLFINATLTIYIKAYLEYKPYPNTNDLTEKLSRIARQCDNDTDYMAERMLELVPELQALQITDVAGNGYIAYKQ